MQQWKGELCSYLTSADTAWETAQSGLRFVEDAAAFVLPTQYLPR